MKQNARKYAPGLTPPGSAAIFVGTRPACNARPPGKSGAACGEIGVDSTDIAAPRNANGYAEVKCPYPIAHPRRIQSPG